MSQFLRRLFLPKSSRNLLRELNSQWLSQYSKTSSQNITNQPLEKHRKYEEVKIPVPWGHVAGKWYGSRDKRPIVGLHGWQDSAATFDRLAPLLPEQIPFLSLDLPGHGLSSWLPAGFMYNVVDYVQLLRRIMQSQNWPKISIVGHSLGGITGFVFNGIFPDKVDMLVSIDILQPLWISCDRAIGHISYCMTNFLLKEALYGSNESEPPCYSWDELVERLYIGLNKSVTLECCGILAKRNSKPSKKEPNKFYFSRDNRLKNMMPSAVMPEMSLQLAKRSICPHLYMKFLQSPYSDGKANYEATLKVLRQNPHFESYKFNGTHHAHLNNPENISPTLNAFILKHRNE